MKVWLVKIHEPLPIDGNVRLYRTGTLAQALAEAGHDVTWWTCTFYHQRRTQRFETDQTIQLAPNYKLELLYSKPYTSNVSPTRFMSDVVGAKRILAKMQTQEKPDVVFCAFPTIEIAHASKRYCARHGVPLVLDVRDLWPDIFETLLPPKKARLAKPLMGALRRRTAASFQAATGITGVSQKYLDFGLRYAGRKQGPNDGVFPLGYPRDLEPQDPEVRDRLLAEMGVDPKKFIAWFVGIFGSSYDILSVVKAARRLKEQGDDSIQFVLCGEGDQFDAVKKEAEGLDNVLLTGWVDKPKLAAIGARADVGLMAYRAVAPQGLPNKLFEYLASGLPVISSLLGETEAAVAKYGCGRTVRPESPEALADALLYYRDHPEERKANGLAGQKVFREEYASEVVYPRLVDYLRQVVARTRQERSS